MLITPKKAIVDQLSHLVLKTYDPNYRLVLLASFRPSAQLLILASWTMMVQSARTQKAAGSNLGKAA